MSLGNQSVPLTPRQRELLVVICESEIDGGDPFKQYALEPIVKLLKGSLVESAPLFDPPQPQIPLASLQMAGVRKRSRKSSSGFPPNPNRGNMEIVALLADGESIVDVASAAEVKPQTISLIKYHYRGDIEAISKLEPGQARYDYLQRRFGLGRPNDASPNGRSRVISGRRRT